MRKLLPLLILLVACVPSSSRTPREKLTSVVGYRGWVRVNATPHQVGANLAFLCRTLTPSEQSIRKSPHRDRWITVYVNPVAKSAMLGPAQGRFPSGSIIVKEKARTPGGAPELLTVMYKREPGYNPANGDWEYLVFNGNGARATDSGRLSSCQSCHAQWRQTDYVSRFYLTHADWQNP